jgi:hypothetical protein
MTSGLGFEVRQRHPNGAMPAMSTSPAIAINGSVSTGGGSSATNTLGAIAADYAQLIAPGANAFQASGAKIFDMDAGILCLASKAQIGRVINGVKVTAETVAQNQLLLNAIGAYCRKNGISIPMATSLLAYVARSAGVFGTCQSISRSSSTAVMGRFAATEGASHW